MAKTVLGDAGRHRASREENRLPRRPGRAVRRRAEGPSVRRDHAPRSPHHVLGRRASTRTYERRRDDGLLLVDEHRAAQGPGGADTRAANSTSASAPAGERFYYASADSEVLGLVLRDAVGKPLADYLSEKIWQPMGAEADATWLVDNGGLRDRLLLPQRHAARLRAASACSSPTTARVDGKQIIPAEWVKAKTTAHAPHLARGVATKYNGYGYQTWLIGSDANALRRLRRARPGHLRRPGHQARHRAHRRRTTTARRRCAQRAVRALDSGTLQAP